MKKYTKTHQSKKALNNHVAKIKKRGGVCSVKNNTVTYEFAGIYPPKYDTRAKRIKTLNTKGRLITFKKQFRWMGKEHWQILTQGIEKQKGSVKIVGFGKDTEWYDSMDKLIAAIDWDKMEEWHQDEPFQKNY